MKRIKWIRETNETLLDLIFGCLIWSALAEIVGVLIVSDKISYTIGIVLGTVVAMMLPYVIIVQVVWMILLVAWQILGLPWGF